MKMPVPLASLMVGDVIYVPFLISLADVVPRHPPISTLMKKILRGEPVQRLCIVLAVNEGSVDVTVTATFGHSTTLPESFDKSYWYPVDPATKEGTLDPLPSALHDDEPQWVSLREAQKITSEIVVYVQYDEESVNLILAAMKG